MSTSGGQQWWVAVALALTAPALAPETGVALPATPAAMSTTHRALGVLHAWEEDRAEAWAAGDVSALRALYSSGAGWADVKLLRRYLDRGLRVEHLLTQVLSAAVLRAGPARLRLRLVDRVAGGAACGHGRCQALPRDHATERTITLVRRNGRWVVTAVR